MKIIDLMEIKNKYIIEIYVSKNLWLFVEGLDENGEVNFGNFNTLNVKCLLVELHDETDIICNISNIKANDSVDSLREKAEDYLTESGYYENKSK